MRIFRVVSSVWGFKGASYPLPAEKLAGSLISPVEGVEMDIKSEVTREIDSDPQLKNNRVLLLTRIRN